MPLILLAEDDPLVAELVCAALEPRGYIVGVLPDGRGIVEIVQGKRPALVILDCAMPIMGGIQALQLIRASSIGFSVPVLMLTARSSFRDEDIARRAGATDYLRKPFDADQLTATVDCLISDALLPGTFLTPPVKMRGRYA